MLTLLTVPLGVLMLFVYLVPIRRTDLLPTAVASVPGLILLVLFALLLALWLVGSVLGSAFFVHAIGDVYSDLKRTPTDVLATVGVWMVTWLVLLTVGLWQLDVYLSIYVVGLLVALPVFGALEHVLCGNTLANGWRRWWYRVRRTCERKDVSEWRRHGVDALNWRSCKRAATGVLVGFLTWFALVIASIAPLFILFLYPTFRSHEIDLATAMLWVGASVPGLLLGWLLLYDRVSEARDEGKRKRRAARVGRRPTLVALFCVALILVSIKPLGLGALGVLGVYSLTPERFAVRSENLAPSLAAVGFEVEADKTRGTNTIAARVRFRFGDVLVLCSGGPGYDPLLPPSDSTNKAALAARCLDVRTNEVRRTMPDPPPPKPASSAQTKMGKH